MKKTFIILIIFIVCILGIGGYFFINRNETLTSARTNSSISYELPKTVFDGGMTIPQTYISFVYPINGFYEKGIKQVPYNMWNNLYGVVGGIGLIPSLKREDTEISQYIDLTIDARQAKKQNNLNGLIASLQDGRDAEYRPNGSLEHIGNTDYYIAKTTSENVIGYDAYAQLSLNYVHIGFQFSTAAGEINKLAADNNEKLFYEYLRNVNLREM
jgi:hypothetical protein